MSGKNLVLELNAKIVSANQIAGFLNFNISKTIGDIKLIFCMQVHIYENVQRQKSIYFNSGPTMLYGHPFGCDLFLYNFKHVFGWRGKVYLKS